MKNNPALPVVFVLLIAIGLAMGQSSIAPSLKYLPAPIITGAATGGTLSNYGLRAETLSTPSAPTVTPQGTTGATTYDYKISATTALGETPASSAGQTTTGNASLDATNFNRITWSEVSNATGYNIYRSAGGATQGLIGAATGLTFDDTGLAATVAAPSENTTGRLQTIGSCEVLTTDFNSGTNANIGTDETTLKTYTLKPNRLANIGDFLRFDVKLTYANNGNTKTSKLYAAGTVIFSDASTTANVGLTMHAIAGRSSNTTLQVMGDGSKQGSDLFAATNAVTSLTLDATAYELKLTGQSSAASNDVAFRGWVVQLCRNGID